jgi:hypothetical protein
MVSYGKFETLMLDEATLLVLSQFIRMLVPILPNELGLSPRASSGRDAC